MWITTGYRRICAAASVLTLCAVQVAPADQAKAAAADDQVAAMIGDTAVTLAEVDAKALSTNMKLAQSLYEARLKAVEQIILEKALGPEASSAGVSVDELIDRRVAEQAKPVSDADVEAYYNSNKQRMRGRTQEEMAGQIRSFLASQNQNEARQKLIDELKNKAGVRIKLEPPRVEVKIAANDPQQGPADAKVTIVEYSDFQ